MLIIQRPKEKKTSLKATKANDGKKQGMLYFRAKKKLPKFGSYTDYQFFGGCL